MRHSRKIRKTKNSNMRKEGHCELAVFLFCVLVQNGRERADAARAHKRVDTCGFHPLVDHPFPLDSLAQIADI